MNKLENSWLAPFGFLLPGTLRSETAREGIWEAVKFLGVAFDLSHDKWVLLYKLIENFNTLSIEFQSQLMSLVKTLLGVRTKDAELIASIVKCRGAGITNAAGRDPTILILDQVDGVPAVFPGIAQREIKTGPLI
jgi:hypothetical protein